LVELLAVVTMIGILSALAIVGYRRYLDASRTGDAKAIIGAIRIAQESYRAETLSYLSCSADLKDWYPGNPSGKVRHWQQPTHADWTCWSTLNVTTDSPTSFGFSVVAGQPGEKPPAPNLAMDITWPNPTTEPWYVVQSGGDANEDGNLSILVASSFSGEIIAENESE